MQWTIFASWYKQTVLIMILMCILILLLNVSIQTAQCQNDTTSFVYEKEWDIGLNGGENEPLFTGFLIVVVDRMENVYVADRMARDIKVYNGEGNYLYTIGRGGRGPGEFSEIRTFGILQNGDGEEHLFVLDPTEARLTELTLKGEVVEITNIFTGETRWPMYIGSLHETDHYLALNRQRSENKRLHIWDREFKQKLNSLVDLNDLSPEFDESYRVLSDFDRGNILVLANDKVFYSPQIYLGEIYSIGNVLAPSGEVERHSGVIHKTPSLEAVSRTSGQSAYTDRVTVDQNEYYLRQYNWSKGLFQLDTGHIIHFTIIGNGDYLDYGFEIYDLNGGLLDYEVIESYAIKDLNRPKLDFEIQFVDKSNSIYISKNVDGVPVVEKYSFSWADS